MSKKDTLAAAQGNDGDGDVDFHLAGTVAQVTLNRPGRRNALSVPMLDRFLLVLDEVEQTAARVVLLRGAGTAFCAGADFADFDDGPDRRGFAPKFHSLLDRLASLRVPVMAFAHGPAVGAGCQIIAQADLTIAAESAVFGITGVKIGLMLDMANITRLVHEVGAATARRLLLTGELLSAREAQVAGLVHRVEADADALEQASAWAELIGSRAPLAVQGHKAALQAVIEDGWLSPDTESWRAGSEKSLRAFRSEDLREGLTAFSERRSPNFRGL